MIGLGMHVQRLSGLLLDTGCDGGLSLSIMATGSSGHDTGALMARTEPLHEAPLPIIRKYMIVPAGGGMTLRQITGGSQNGVLNRRLRGTGLQCRKGLLLMGTGLPYLQGATPLLRGRPDVADNKLCFRVPAAGYPEVVV